jgi:hypothetical protein
MFSLFFVLRKQHEMQDKERKSERKTLFCLFTPGTDTQTDGRTERNAEKAEKKKNVVHSNKLKADK